MSFAPIVTPFARLSIVPEDMPIYSLNDVPNALIQFRAAPTRDSPVVLVPYRISSFSRVAGAERNRVIQLLVPLLEAQAKQPSFVQKYGSVTLGAVTQARRALDDAVTQARPGPCNIGSLVRGQRDQRTFMNVLYLSILNGVNFRTYPDLEEFQTKVTYAAEHNAKHKIFGTCNIFGKQAGCELSHDFFELRRLTHSVWTEHIERRLNEVFPFLPPAGMFHSLHLMP